MSDAYDKGKAFEVTVRKLTKQKLKLDVKRDSMSGAGLHKQDIRDRYDELPIFIECKDQKTLKPKEWWRTADGKASMGQAPVVVFPDNEEVLCVMRYADLLQFIQEAKDWEQSAEDMRSTPILINAANVAEVVAVKVKGGAKTCRDGHISDDYGYCNIKGCKYSRGYKKPKVKT